MLEDVHLFFASADAKELDSFQTIEKNAGRVEKRTCRKIKDISWLEAHKWPGLRSVFAIERVTEARGCRSQETSYSISSCNHSPEQLMALAREHWKIESMHWLLDVTLCGLTPFWVVALRIALLSNLSLLLDFITVFRLFLSFFGKSTKNGEKVRLLSEKELHFLSESCNIVFMDRLAGLSFALRQLGFILFWRVFIMICPNCGREIPDGTVCPCTLQPPPLSDNPAMNVIKTIGSSPLFLGMAVLLSLSTLFTIFSSAGLNDTIYNLYYYAYAMGLDLDAVEEVFDAMRSSAVAGAVFSSVPAILVAVAMWLHYISCRGRQNGNISTAGLTICKVLSYIYMIGLCLIALLVTGVCALVIVAFLSDAIPVSSMARLYGADADELIMTIIIVLALFIAFFLFLMILAITYQASIIRMINRTKMVSQTGQADERVSGYLVGMTYFVAIYNLIVGVAMLFTGPLGGLTGICQGIAYILIAVLLGRYRKSMNSVMYPPVNPMGGYGWTPQPGYGPQPGSVPQPQNGYDPQNAYAPQQGPADGFQQPPQPSDGPDQTNPPPMQ